MTNGRSWLALLGALLAGCGATKTVDPVERVVDASADVAIPDAGPLVIPDAGAADTGPQGVPCAIDQCATGPKRCSADHTAVLTPTKGTCVDGFCAFEYTREECATYQVCSDAFPDFCQDPSAYGR